MTDLEQNPPDLDELRDCENCRVDSTMIDGTYRIYRCRPHKIFEGVEVDGDG